jgi:hypothetical protein
MYCFLYSNFYELKRSVKDSPHITVTNEAEGSRDAPMPQHGGPPGWLEESDPAG